MTYKRNHILIAECYERDEEKDLECYGRVAEWDAFIEGAWRPADHGLMALYHYVLAYAPREEEP